MEGVTMNTLFTSFIVRSKIMFILMFSEKENMEHVSIDKSAQEFTRFIVLGQDLGYGKYVFLNAVILIYFVMTKYFEIYSQHNVVLWKEMGQLK